jgi:hypothetical protein
MRHDIDTQNTTTIRLLGAEDAAALRELAERDGALLPIGPVIGAWEGPRLLAAVSVRENNPTVIADPFEQSAHAAAMLVERHGQLRRSPTKHERARARRGVAELRV